MLYCSMLLSYVVLHFELALNMKTDIDMIVYDICLYYILYNVASPRPSNEFLSGRISIASWPQSHFQKVACNLKAKDRTPY